MEFTELSPEVELVVSQLTKAEKLLRESEEVAVAKGGELSYTLAYRRGYARALEDFMGKLQEVQADALT